VHGILQHLANIHSNPCPCPNPAPCTLPPTQQTYPANIHSNPCPANRNANPCLATCTGYSRSVNSPIDAGPFPSSCLCRCMTSSCRVGRRDRSSAPWMPDHLPAAAWLGVGVGVGFELASAPLMPGRSLAAAFTALAMYGDNRQRGGTPERHAIGSHVC
jgi:hypothetical protein